MGVACSLIASSSGCSASPSIHTRPCFPQDKHYRGRLHTSSSDEKLNSRDAKSGTDQSARAQIFYVDSQQIHISVHHRPDRDDTIASIPVFTTGYAAMSASSGTWKGRLAGISVDSATISKHKTRSCWCLSIVYAGLLPESPIISMAATTNRNMGSSKARTVFCYCVRTLFTVSTRFE